MTQLTELTTRLSADEFKVLAFPCNQFLLQSPGSSEQIAGFLAKYFVHSPSSCIGCEKVHVNGPETHPVYHFLRYNEDSYRVNSEKIRVVPWNFAKFLVDQEGRVAQYFGCKVEPLTMEPHIRALLDGSKQGPPSQPPTVSAQDAPQGFCSALPATAE